MKTRSRASAIVTLAALGASGLGPSVPAAETEFGYDAGIEQLYSQDILRVGEGSGPESDDLDGYLTTLRLNSGVQFSTPRSQTSFRYAPEYTRYGQVDSSEPLDTSYLEHRFGALWRLRPGPLSLFEMRQGLSATTRQTGFQDFAEAGGNASEPITYSRRLVWDLAPRFSVTPSQDTSVVLDALYREERYDRADLIDSRQAGVQGAIGKRISSSQTLGGRLRADAFDFEIPGVLDPIGYDRFINAEAVWSRRIEDRWSLLLAGGAYRASGPGLVPVTRPTVDLSSQWRWQRTYLSMSYELRYTSGGGISTSNRSQWGQVALTKTWGRGFEGGGDFAYIYRASPTAQLSDQVPLEGWSLRLRLSKRWQSGVGMNLGLYSLRQERQVGFDLAYGEASVGVTYAPKLRGSPTASSG